MGTRENMNLETFKICARAYFPSAKFKNTVYCDHACISFVIVRAVHGTRRKHLLTRFCWFDDYGTLIETEDGRWMADEKSMLAYLKSLYTAEWRAIL